MAKRIPSILRWAGPQRRGGGSRRSVASSVFTGGAGGPTISDIFITPQTALTFTAVFAAIRVLSEDIASLPLETFRVRKGGGREHLRDHRVNHIFTVSPNDEVPDFNWRESWVSHCLGWGNGYAEIERLRSGEPYRLHLLHPSTTEATRDDAGHLRYRIEGGRRDSLPYENCLHLAGLGFNGLSGYSPIGLAREAIALGKATEEFGASVFGNRGMPGGFLKYPGKLDDTVKAQLRADWDSLHAGRGNALRTAVLENGLTWEGVSIAPDDAQFLATRAFQVIEIARIFRLPPHKLADYSQSHLANVEASNLDYLITTLRPWLIRIEKTINLRLLSDKERSEGYYVKHDMRALLRASAKDRAEYLRVMFQLGVYTPDEIRELEDLNPIGPDDGGDKRFVPGNLAFLDGTGATVPVVKDKQVDPALGGGTGQ